MRQNCKDTAAVLASANGRIRVSTGFGFELGGITTCKLVQEDMLAVLAPANGRTTARVGFGRLS